VYIVVILVIYAGGNVLYTQRVCLETARTHTQTDRHE